MNKRRMENLAKFLETIPPEHFNMFTWVQGREKDVMCLDDVLNSCGTTCCIAGWAVLKAGKCLWAGASVGGKKRPGKHYAEDFAKIYLGLSEDEHRRLFFKHFWPEVFANKDDSPSLAAARIRHMIKEGV